MKTIIHVNQHIIKRNKKTGERTPPITVKDYKRNRKGSFVIISGAQAIVTYRPDKPLDCGAQVWIETEGDVQVI